MASNPSHLLAGLLLAGLALSPQRGVASAQSSDKFLGQGAPSGYQVLLLPEDGVYPGDRVSFIVVPAPTDDVEELELSIQRTANGETQEFGRATFGRFGIGAQRRAVLRWAWDTAGLAAGKVEIEFRVLPVGPSWRQVVTLRRPELQPPAQRGAGWQSIQTACCIVYFTTGTAGQRDLEEMLEAAEAQAASVSGLMGVEFAEPVEVVILPRTLGHGGFATREIYVSYLDRNYAGSDFGLVLHHELVHILDLRLGGGLRPTMLVEGLATYLTGGHFKPEPLLPRAAALPELGWYVPLQRLADNFYFEQHEVGYLQAAALVEYMVERWGYAAFDVFYRSIQPASDGRHSAALDAALRENFGLTLDELEIDFKARLAEIEVTEANREDVRLTVELFDAIRRYQQALDPNAYFLSAWLLDIGEMQEHNITADYVRHPNTAANQALEALLAGAEDALQAGDLTTVARALAAVNATLDAHDAGLRDEAAFAADPLAADALGIVRALRAQGYEIQQLAVGDGRAEATATQPMAAASQVWVSVLLIQEGDLWQVASANR